VRAEVINLGSETEKKRNEKKGKNGEIIRFLMHKRQVVNGRVVIKEGPK